MTLKPLTQWGIVGAVLAVNFAIFSAIAQTQRPSDANINGRLESQAATITAITNECAARTGQLYDTLEKAGAAEKAKRENDEAKQKAIEAQQPTKEQR